MPLRPRIYRVFLHLQQELPFKAYHAYNRPRARAIGASISRRSKIFCNTLHVDLFRSCIQNKVDIPSNAVGEPATLLMQAYKLGLDEFCHVGTASLKREDIEAMQPEAWLTDENVTFVQEFSRINGNASGPARLRVYQVDPAAVVCAQMAEDD